MIRVMTLHIKCRNNIYPNSNVKRLTVPDIRVLWESEWLDYKPIDFTSEKIMKNPPYADPAILKVGKKIKWNALDGKIDRRSYNGTYIVQDNTPLNIIGRTGITGRGNLGRWGPNHAADTVLTRWVDLGPSSSETPLSTLTPSTVTLLDLIKQAIVPEGESCSRKLQFLAIERKHDGQWAFPGGMVDEGEDDARDTAPREFGEEAMGTLDRDDKGEVGGLVQGLKGWYDKFGDIVYRGYVDDPRNTDNAWMETCAVNVHIDKGSMESDASQRSIFGQFPLKAGDDAKALKWIDIGPPWNADNQLDNLYASHMDIVRIVAQRHGIKTE